MAIVNVNTFYEYGINKLGSYDGSPYSGTSAVPHPQAVVKNTTGGTDTIIDLSSIKLGGINGLNN
ncbi:MAG: hypothetical protein K9I82_04270 [Chitinophagaceae bacterium]|jgi:hypothetical protein|nr:hypothetical protein [Chitinophagaceae bacterium]